MKLRKALDFLAGSVMYVFAACFILIYTLVIVKLLWPFGVCS